MGKWDKKRGGEAVFWRKEMTVWHGRRMEKPGEFSSQMLLDLSEATNLIGRKSEMDIVNLGFAKCFSMSLNVSLGERKPPNELDDSVIFPQWNWPRGRTGGVSVSAQTDRWKRSMRTDESDASAFVLVQKGTGGGRREHAESHAETHISRNSSGPAGKYYYDILEEADSKRSGGQVPISVRPSIGQFPCYAIFNLGSGEGLKDNRNR